jgi:post-segregation antitoxin (ccd killing protein)
MRKPLYDPSARKKAVSMTINEDLYSTARRLGVNASQVAEQALSAEVTRISTEQLRREIAEELKATDAYEADHGSCHELMKDYLEGLQADSPPARSE